MLDDEQAAEQVLRNLRRIIRRITEHSRQLSQEVGLTLAQLVVLKAIGAVDGGELTAAAVCSRVQLSPPTVSRIVDRLEESGLVVRERSRVDRRRVALHLTPAGVERCRSLPVLLHDRFHQRLIALGRNERMALLDALERISAMIDATDIDAAPLLAAGGDVGDGV